MLCTSHSLLSTATHQEPKQALSYPKGSLSLALHTPNSQVLQKQGSHISQTTSCSSYTSYTTHLQAPKTKHWISNTAEQLQHWPGKQKMETWPCFRSRETSQPALGMSHQCSCPGQTSAHPMPSGPSPSPPPPAESWCISRPLILVHHLPCLRLWMDPVRALWNQNEKKGILLWNIITTMPAKCELQELPK